MRCYPINGGSEGPKEGGEAGQLGRESNLGGAGRARGAQGKGPLPPSPCPLSAVDHRWPSDQDTQMTEPAWVYTRTHTRACLERRASPHHSPSSSPRTQSPRGFRAVPGHGYERPKLQSIGQALHTASIPHSLGTGKLPPPTHHSEHLRVCPASCARL